jgi:hypothetical protein
MPQFENSRSKNGKSHKHSSSSENRSHVSESTTGLKSNSTRKRRHKKKKDIDPTTLKAPVVQMRDGLKRMVYPAQSEEVLKLAAQGII